jgi:hypothetical protein
MTGLCEALVSLGWAAWNVEYRRMGGAPSEVESAHAEDADGSQRAIATVLVRRAGAIHHFWSSELVFTPRDGDQGPRHVDFMWPLLGMWTARPTAAATSSPRSPTANDALSAAATPRRRPAKVPATIVGFAFERSSPSARRRATPSSPSGTPRA